MPHNDKLAAMPTMSVVLRLDLDPNNIDARNVWLCQVARQAAREYAHLVLENKYLEADHASAAQLLDFLDHNHLSLGPYRDFSTPEDVPF